MTLAAGRPARPVVATLLRKIENLPMLHAIPEAEIEDFSHPRQELAEDHDPLSSDGSLSEPHSDALRDRSAGGGSVGGMNGSPETGDDPTRMGIPGLLTLVESERNKMSKAVLASADGLSAAVALARKRLAANIAAIEEQIREERQQLEESRSANRPDGGSLSGFSSMDAEGLSIPTSQAEYEAIIERLRDQKRTAESERDAYKEQVDLARQELADLRRKYSQVDERNAALVAEVSTLRSNLSSASILSKPSAHSAADATATPSELPVNRIVDFQPPFSSTQPRESVHAAAAANPAAASAAPAAAAAPAPAAITASQSSTSTVQPAPAAAAQAPAAQVPSRAQSPPRGGGAAAAGAAAAGGRVVEGILRRKKPEHSMFEDPWKLRLQCAVTGGTLECVPLVDNRPVGSARER